METREEMVKLAKALLAADKRAKTAIAKAHRDYMRARKSSQEATAAKAKVATLAASLASMAAAANR